MHFITRLSGRQHC